MATDIMYGQMDDHGGLSERLEASWGGDDCSDELMGNFGNTIMPVGCVVCTVRLVAAFQLGEAGRVARRLTNSFDQQGLTDIAVDDFGDYAPGRWAWLLRDVKPLIPPTPMKGAQGFFNLPQGWLCNAA